MFRVNISTANAAFQDGSLRSEVARILRKTADRFESGKIFDLDGRFQSTRLRDVNGNTVGSCDLVDG